MTHCRTLAHVAAKFGQSEKTVRRVLYVMSHYEGEKRQALLDSLIIVSKVGIEPMETAQLKKVAEAI